MSKSKIENPINNKRLPKREQVKIVFKTDAQQAIIYEFDRFIEQKILAHKDSGKRTPKPKTNDFYLNALVRGMKRELFDNKTDEIADIAAQAVIKVTNQADKENAMRQNLTTVSLISKMEYITEMLNYILPILQSLAPDYFEATLDPSGDVKQEYFDTPIGFENMKKQVIEKWHNKIRKDSNNDTIETVLFKKGK
ncbi:hypothetical protein [Williamsoniiplasma lucivorax]|uniref:Uncharacterized protein n=1 Tax=Williamsoniiplasma lucivorax TaxID=209274 RepID=A0A2S5RF71_9MOLU|nr:hypothetical protein [Williamsoniiplasma lucivorax]PPE05960.1 hypothetical protein ELUCI_v1c02510 [Williamsoniiplasma lucivorax]